MLRSRETVMIKIAEPMIREVEGNLEAVGSPKVFGSAFRVAVKIGDTWAHVIGSIPSINRRLAGIELGDVVRATCTVRKNAYESLWVIRLEKCNEVR